MLRVRIRIQHILRFGKNTTSQVPSLRIFLIGILLITLAGTLKAQGVPSGYQEYLVLGRAQNVWDMMDKVVTGEGAASQPDGINSLVTATANADSEVIYYDQWEDGFEADLFNPVQASTLVLGDGDPTNGDACDFTLNPACTNDNLNRGDYVNLASNAGLGAGCTVPSVDPTTYTELCSSVPVNPRCATPGACTDAEIRFDGGDLIRSTGGPLSVVHSQNPMSQYLGGSTEILPREAVEDAFAYSIPVGEDIYSAGTLTEPFKYVDLNIVAYEDATSVLVTSPGAGSVSFVLNRGEHWTSLGSIDDGAPDPSRTITVNAGTKISTSGPISGFLFTGASGTFATRHFALIPDVLHSTDYITTADGDDSTVIAGSDPDRPAAIYIFNPHIGFSIDVNVTDSSGTTTITVPANSTTAQTIPDFSTVRMTSTDTFWGITAYDYSTPASDWGHSWLASRYLTTNYTVSYAPGNYIVPPDANYNAVYIAPTQDNTRILVDFDNDDLFDEVDLDGDGVADAGAADPSCDPATPNCLYTYNVLSSMPVFDPSDFDNTGTRILTNKPVAVAWGQETDVTDGTEPAHDTGYTVYPALFVDPVLEIAKTADPIHVPIAGGTVSYTLTIDSGDFSGSAPLTGLQVYDLLPPGITGSDYVTGSTVITYPDLTQDTTDPTTTEDPPGSGRWRLDWTLSPNTLAANRRLTISYQVAIPSAPGSTPRSLRNEGRALAVLGGSKFEPFDTATVSQSDITVDKSVDLTTAQIGDVLHYTINVNNNGLAAETNVLITDAIPADTSFCDSTTLPAGICSNPSGGGSFDASQNAVVWSAASLAVGGPYTYSFDVIVNTGVADGTLIKNSASYESTQTPYFTSNSTSTEILSPELNAVKSGPAGPLHPNELATFEILVSNTSAVPASGILITDPLQANTSYLLNSMEWRRNTGTWTSLTDAGGDDEGALNTSTTPDQLELRIASLPAGEDISFRFEVRVDSGTSGLYASNQATVQSDQTALINTNLVQIPIVGDADVTGHLFVDSNGNGTQDAGEADLAGVDVSITDVAGNSQTVTTDASGNYLVTVEAGSTTLDVDESDPDFPPGATLTTGNDPQTVTAVSGGSTAAGDVGYQPPSFLMTKQSDAVAHEVIPGQIVHYTISATNRSSLTETNVTVDDPAPAGMNIVSGSTTVSYSQPVFRVTEYYVANTDFSGNTYDLSLDQNLESNYFVMVQGSDGDGSGANNRGPDEDYVALTADPFGTGELNASAAADQIRLTRHNSVDGWQGVVTVVECLRQCSTEGFVLRDARRLEHTGASTSGAETSTNPWTDLNQIMLFGGFNGAGCDTPETNNAATKVCQARIFPSGTDQINWTRDGGGTTLSDATSTVLVLEWGSAWSLQRVNITGNNGGNGADDPGEYNTASISPVTRAHTWVWGTGHTNDNGIGDAGEAVLLTLGDGVAINAVENSLAAGIEYSGNAVDFEVYALSHNDLSTDYIFKADADSANLIVDVPTASPQSRRMAFVTNGCNGTGTAYPRPFFSARYLNDTTIRLERRRSGQDFPAWVQGLDFSGIKTSTSFTGGDPSALLTAADHVDLGPGDSLTITYDLEVDPNISSGISTITNTATLNSDSSGPYTASNTDQLRRPAVTVEPNNANFVVYDAANPQTRTYSHGITNNGDLTDSFDLSAMSMQGAANPGAGWMVELIDPATGAVIATDTDFTDGTWDGGTNVNTGSLASGETANYEIRVTVPAGTPVDTAESTTLTATSSAFGSVSAFATDDTVVADQSGDVVLLPDQSGVVSAGGDVVYPHWIFNNTGATDIFDLNLDPTEAGWSAKVYNDSNGDGVYTPGIDVEISNSASLADGDYQLVFVVVSAPAGASPGDTDVTHFTAVSRNDTSLFDGVSDTTTVDPASTHDLSGGGTVLVSAGDDCSVGAGCPSFPGTLKSLEGAADRFDFSITASAFFGLDGLNHPTQLWIDTDGDDIVDTQIAEDSDGDGVWDSISPGYDTNGDGDPDVGVGAGGSLAYELRRPVDAAAQASRDPVTLTTTSQATGEKDSVTATNLLHAPTWAMLNDFYAAFSGSKIVLHWRTGQEIANRGFQIRRRQAGSRIFSPSSGLLPARGDSPMGAEYRWVDSDAVPGTSVSYVLSAVDQKGASRILGIIEAQLDREHLPVDFEAPPAGGYERRDGRPALPRSPTPDQEAPAPRSPEEAVTRVRIRTSHEGLTFLPADSIATAMGQSEGTILNWIATGQLVLHHNDLENVETCARENLGPGAIFVDGFENGTFCAWDFPGAPLNVDSIAWMSSPAGDGIYFYAEAIDSIYTDENVYSLEFGAAKEMAFRESENEPPEEHGNFFETRHFEEEGPYPLTSVMTDPDGDFWFWDYVFVNDEYGIDKNTISVDFQSPGRSSGQYQASISLQFQAESTDKDIPMEHQVEIRINGVTVGAGEWDGSTAYTLAVHFDQALLNDGTNTLEIVAPANSGIASEIFYLDSFDLSYRRDYRADQDRIVARSEGRKTLKVGGFTRDDIDIFDISDPRNPVRIEPAETHTTSDGIEMVFSAKGGSLFLMQALDAAEAPGLEADLPSSLHSESNAADYVVIAGRGLEEAAQELAAYRAGTGFRPMVVRLQDIYDEFSQGIVDPMAIRAFLSFAAEKWRIPPSYVVLAGDSSFDFKDRLGYGGNILPSPMVSTPEGLFPSDNRLADFVGADGVPDVAIGRIPARTAEQLSLYVEKLRDFENSTEAWTRHSLWVADAADAGGEFAQNSEELITLAPEEILNQRIYVDVLGQDEARTTLLDGLSEGVELIHFLGHSNLQQMGNNSGLLRSEDVSSLNNSDRQPVLLAMTCAMGRFDRIYFDTIGESLLLDDGGGITALWAPSGLSFNVDGVQLSRELTPSILAGTRLGEAIRRSLGDYLGRADKALPDVPYLYTLLGDPAIRMHP